MSQWQSIQRYKLHFCLYAALGVSCFKATTSHRCKWVYCINSVVFGLQERNYFIGHTINDAYLLIYMTYFFLQKQYKSLCRDIFADTISSVKTDLLYLNKFL